ncbi:MAG: glucose-6-phosphate dehydrogenase assembly protein OpcA [Candidatus Melainabacteria bacterium]|nr:glucose-6-phosphate dehydrogenase assembly protein OpcA [Candidatus Melainabacteria bacterium]
MAQTEVTDTNSILSFLSGQMALVEVAKIERELSKLWKMSTENGEGGAYVIKACALNFVLLVDSSLDDSGVDFDNLLADITLTHPMRALLALVKTDESRSEENALIEAWVSARCHFLPGRLDKQMCCEQITVSYTGREFCPASLSSVISPLVIADLPSWLYVPQLHFQPSELKTFLPSFDYLIVDSRSPQPTFDQATFERFSFLLEEAKNVNVIDLAWLAIKPWRQAIAFAFDEKDVSLSTDCLNAIDTIDLVCGDKGGFIQSLLFVAWLGSRLKLRFLKLIRLDDGACRLAFMGAHEPFTVNIRADGPVAGLASMQVSFHKLGCCSVEEHLHVTFQEGALTVKHEDRKEFVELPRLQCRAGVYSSTECGRSELVDDALACIEQDPIYLETVSYLLNILKSEA